MTRGAFWDVPIRAESAVAIRLTGSFTVTRGSATYTAGTIGGKARTLLKLLAVERGHIVPSHRIVEVLWDGDPPRRPAENVATLVSRLRKMLGADVVTGGRPGYRLGAAPAVVVDVDEAAVLIAEAERQLTADHPAVAQAAATRALDILGDGRVLVEEPDAPWAEQAAAEVAGLLRRAQHVAAGAALGTGEHDRAQRVAECAVRADRFDEAAHRLLMRAYAAAGEAARALQAYESLRAALAAELGADPAPQTRAVHLEILRERSPVRQAGPVVRAAPIGRDAEMGRLAAAWTAATAGRTAAVVVAGEAGIGKSRLLAELVRTVEAPGFTVLSARCHRAERALFLQPFVDALKPQVTRLAPDVLREVAGGRAAALAALVPEVARVLDPLPPEPCVEGDERRRVFDAVAVFLRGLAARCPLLLVLDDLHNAGTATVELVDYLARRAGGARLLIVTGLRPEEAGEAFEVLGGAVTRLDLGPLRPEAVSRLAAAAGQSELSDRVHRRTRGHPFFVTEMLRCLAAGEAGIPDSVRAAVLVRVHRRGAQTERLLRAAATLGARFAPDVLAEMLGLSLPQVAYLCERALEARLLVVSGAEYEFANDLIREVLHTTTPAPTRRLLAGSGGLR